MQRFILPYLSIIVLAAGLSACGGGGSSSGFDSATTTTDAPTTVEPGATLPLGSTVTIDQSGGYLLPAGASTITTQCFGQVTVTISRPGLTTPEVNTCSSPDGSANQTNVVSGAANVTYVLAMGATAQVTVN